MNKRIVKNAAALRALSRANKAVRNSMLSHASMDLVMTLVQLATDIIKGNIALSSVQLRQLRPYERLLKRFIASRTSLRERRAILQKGGFIGILLKPLLGLLGGALGSMGQR